MSWLLCMDESGHDHQNTPYEVRGGIALHAKNVWNFTQEMKNMERERFGCELSRHGSEIKGAKLLKKKRIKLYKQSGIISDEERRKRCFDFLKKEGQENTTENAQAYAQASLGMVDDIFNLLTKYNATIFASLIPQGTKKPFGKNLNEFLRKDLVFLFERYFHFLENEDDYGILIMDETEKQNDKKFVRQVENYFKKTEAGRIRSSRIVPAPFFVSSDMAYPVQAADVVIYCINWGFRTDKINGVRNDFIHQRYSKRIYDLQFKRQGYIDPLDQTTKFYMWGVIYVPDPFTSRT